MITLTLVVLVASAALAGGSPDSNTRTQTIGVTVPTVRIVGVYDDATITVVAPTTAGTAPDPAVSNTTYLRYTALDRLSGSTTVHSGIDAAVSTTTGHGLPAGTQLQLAAGAPAGSDAHGNLGTYFATLSNLTTSAGQRLIANIGSGYTGTGTTDGASLVYTLTITDWTQIRAGATPTWVVFTMTDN
jgi:hypothetical protein